MATEGDKAPQEQPQSAPAPSAADAPDALDQASAKPDDKGKGKQKNAEEQTASANAEDTLDKDLISNPVMSGALLDSSKEESEPAAKPSGPEEPAAAPAPPPDAGAVESSSKEAGKSEEPPAEEADAAPPSDPAPAPVPTAAEASATVNGVAGNDVEMKEAPSTAASDTPAPMVGDKRKADETADETNGEVPEKKAKTDDAPESNTNGDEKPAPKKAGRPKKGKKEHPVPTQTLRKTRSQTSRSEA